MNILSKLLFRIRPLVLKDQPNGQCSKCKWNLESNFTEDNFGCNCPITYITNPTCMNKLNIVFNMNINNYLYSNN